MIDYIFNFPTEQDAINFFDTYNSGKTELAGLVGTDENGKKIWDGSRTIVGYVVDQPSIYDVDNPDKLLQFRVLKPGFWIWIGVSQLYDNLTNKCAWYCPRGYPSPSKVMLDFQPQPMGQPHKLDVKPDLQMKPKAYTDAIKAGVLKDGKT